MFFQGIISIFAHYLLWMLENLVCDTPISVVKIQAPCFGKINEVEVQPRIPGLSQQTMKAAQSV